MDIERVLAELKLKIGIGDLVVRTIPSGCCGAIISQTEHTVKSVGIYRDSFGRNILIYELSNGDFLSESQIILLRKANVV